MKMTLNEILNWHLSHYPLLQAEDIYKLLYQSVYGPGHLLTLPGEIKERLEQEIARVRFNSRVPETEPLDPEGLLIRVNLAPIAHSQEKQRLLLEALIQTCRTFLPKPELLPARIGIALNWCQEHMPIQVERLNPLLQNQPSPPQHSEVYLKNYCPAYRVILSRLWQP
ncbi:MAG: hypothetical protein ABIK23_02990 [candidate division WOR-3 bacterium]